MRWIDFGNHDIFAYLNKNKIAFPSKRKVMINFLSKKKKKFFSRGTTKKSYFFVTKSTIDQSPFLLFWNILYTHNFWALSYSFQETCQIQGIPIWLTKMTISHFESVKSEIRSNHTSQYTRPSNSLRGLSKRFAI